MQRFFLHGMKSSNTSFFFFSLAVRPSVLALISSLPRLCSLFSAGPYFLFLGTLLLLDMSAISSVDHYTVKPGSLEPLFLTVTLNSRLSLNKVPESFYLITVKLT